MYIVLFIIEYYAAAIGVLGAKWRQAIRVFGFYLSMASPQVSLTSQFFVELPVELELPLPSLTFLQSK